MVKRLIQAFPLSKGFLSPSKSLLTSKTALASQTKGHRFNQDHMQYHSFNFEPIDLQFVELQYKFGFNQ